MKLTKYTHACLVLQEHEKLLVIDPGQFSNPPDDLQNVVGIIVTEDHYDHCDKANVDMILANNPSARVFTTATAADKLENDNAEVIESAQTIEHEGFSISFAPGDHAPIHEHSPNTVLTIHINNLLYYPSDSFIESTEPVEVLALPMSGPWHKVAEAVDLVKATGPTKIVATHNGLYNETGHEVTNSMLQNFIDDDIEFIYLEPGQSTEL